MKKLLCLLSTCLLVACSKGGTSKEVEPLQNEIIEGAANIIFIMDDGWESQYTEGYRILDKYGMKGNIGVVTSLVGTKNYVDKGQLDELYARGYDLINHTKTHLYLDSLSKKKQKKEIMDAKEWLEKHGYKRGLDTFVYPYGAYNQDTLKILEDEDFIFARGVLDGEVSGLNLEAKTINVKTNLDPEKVKKRIDGAIESGGTLTLMNHRFGDEEDDYDMFYKTEMFEEIVKYVDEKRKQGKLNVLTVSEYVKLTENKESLRESHVNDIEHGNLSENQKDSLTDGKWLVVWEENFDTLNKTKWNLINSVARYNSELQHYLPENVEVKDNSMYLIGKKQSYEGHDYTSGKVTTEDKFEFKYGKVEFSAKTDYSDGSFPAVWLLPAGKDYLPEIDIFEAVGSEKGYAYYVNHYKEGEKMKKSAKGYKLENPTEFHKYAIEWNKNEIKWFVDDKLIHTATEGVPDVPMYLIMNLAIGGVWPGSPTEESVFPMDFVVKDLKVMKEVVK